MGIFSPILNVLKKDPYSTEDRQYQESLKKNPDDIKLRAQYAKFCLRRHFTRENASQRLESVEWFENNDFSDLFDPEFYYLMGRYYHRNNDEKAKVLYLRDIREFNRYIEMNPYLKKDFMELALATVLHLMTLQPDHCDPEIVKFFDSVHKCYPLHVKRVKLENEIEKSGAGSSRVKQMSDEIKKLKAEFMSIRKKGKPKE